MTDTYNWKLKPCKIITDTLNRINRSHRPKDVNYLSERLASKVYNSYESERLITIKQKNGQRPQIGNSQKMKSEWLINK